MVEIDDLPKIEKKIDFTIEEPILGNIVSIQGPPELTRTLTSQAAVATKYIWDFGDGTPLLDTITNPIIHTFPEPGNYTVRHRACLPAYDCPINDPICCCSDWCTQTLIISPLPPVQAGLDLLIGLGFIVGTLLLGSWRDKCPSEKNRLDCLDKGCAWSNNKCSRRQ